MIDRLKAAWRRGKLWMAPLLGFGGALLALFTFRRLRAPRPPTVVVTAGDLVARAEARAAANEAKKLEIEHDAAHATKVLEEKYAREIKDMAQADAVELERLRNDPAALARALAARRARKRGG